MSIDLGNIISKLNEFLLIAAFFFGGFLAAFHISLVVWTFRDSRSRTRDLFAQLLATLLVFVFSLLGLFLYFMLRPRETLAESYERALEEEALLRGIEERPVCPNCGQPIEADFTLCPACRTQLKRACPECGRLLRLQWETCPYCGYPAPPPEPAPLQEPTPLQELAPPQEPALPQEIEELEEEEFLIT
jgi:RNA polymerase subunit RPABC4/transcription elongation factor Spt4